MTWRQKSVSKLYTAHFLNKRQQFWRLKVIKWQLDAHLMPLHPVPWINFGKHIFTNSKFLKRSTSFYHTSETCTFLEISSIIGPVVRTSISKS
eukprot:c40137_g1_i1 orf=9-287(+)